MSRHLVDNVNKKSAGTPDDLFEAIHAVMHLFRAGQYRVASDGGHELTHLEGKLLGFFARHPGATLRDVVADWGRDKGQLARLIKNLRGQGLLEARADAGDRRSVRLHRTAEGRAVHLTLQRQLGRAARLAVGGFSDAERATLHALLQKVRANLAAS